MIPPTQRQKPETIDITSRPVVELLTKSGASILVETSADGQVIEVYSSDKKYSRTLAFSWKQSREVESGVVRDQTITKLYDSNGDGLPDGRKVFTKNDNGQFILLSSEKLQWSATPDELDPEVTKKK